MFTCEPVLAEACYLLRQIKGGREAVVEFVERRLLKVGLQIEEDAAAIRRLLSRYAAVPMSLADACLVRMAERIVDSRVMTLDGDFRIYRRHGRQVIPVLMPEELR